MSEPRLLVIASPHESAMIRRGAELAGIRVWQASPGEVDAVMIDAAPDVVLVASPEATQVARRLVERRGSLSTPRLVVVGGPGVAVRSLEDARALGADDFVPRPVDVGAVVAQVLVAAGRSPVPLPRRADLGTEDMDAALEGALASALGAAVASFGAAAPASPARGALTGADLAQRRLEIVMRLQFVAEADYFTLLGVSHDATSDDVAACHAQVVAQLDPDLLGPELVAELGRDLDELRGCLREAALVLGDDAMRASYLLHLAL